MTTGRLNLTLICTPIALPPIPTVTSSSYHLIPSYLAFQHGHCMGWQVSIHEEDRDTTMLRRVSFSYAKNLRNRQRFVCKPFR